MIIRNITKTLIIAKYNSENRSLQMVNNSLDVKV
jgi:hypothetical protein